MWTRTICEIDSWVSISRVEIPHSYAQTNLSLSYQTESEHNITRRCKCTKLYSKHASVQEGPAKYWALDQAQKNKRTVIYVFQNGLKLQSAVKFVLIESDLYNWPRTLRHIGDKLDKPEGVR